MNLRIINAITIFYVALTSVQGRKLSAQRDKSSPDWTESLDDFKVLVHAITFGEDIPSHQSNPLQVMLIQEAADSNMAKPPFKIPKGWFGKGKGNNSKNKKMKKQKKNKTRKNRKNKNSTKMQSISPSQIRDQQSLDDLALLNFLVQMEEPNSRLAVQSPQNKKHLSSLVMADNRYNEIKKKLQLTKSGPKKGRLTSKSRSNDNLIETNPYQAKASASKKFSIKGTDPKSDKTKWNKKIDAKGLKNTLTLSVAFGVIVTALFCVIVQLFKLFASPKSSGSSGAFDQINRRSTYGYDRIALDMEEDEETAQLN